MLPMTEVHNAYGRSDLEVDVGERHWVFEFKFAKDSTQAQKLLAEGIAQIKGSRYGEGVDKSKLQRAVMVFDAAERKIGAFAEVPAD